MKVSCDEGVASHVGPELCGDDRKVIFEALTGEGKFKRDEGNSNGTGPIMVPFTGACRWPARIFLVGRAVVADPGPAASPCAGSIPARPMGGCA